MNSKRTIMAVDDNRSVLQIINKALQKHFDVILADSGEEALRAIGMRKPDLILLDVDMPDISGFDLIKKFQENPHTADIPVIFISGDDGNELAGLNLGGVDYVTKPLIPEILRRRCELHIELSTQTDISFARMILDNAPFACTFWSPHKHALVYANNAVVSLFKLSDKNALINDYSNYMPKYQPNGELSMESIREHLGEALELGNAEFAWTCLDSEGEQVPTWVSLRRIIIQNDNYVIGYIRDLRRDTEVKKVLRGELDRLQHQVNDAPVDFIEINSESIIYLNNAALQDFHCRPGDPLADLFSDSADCDGFLNELRRNDGKLHNAVFRLRVKNGSLRRFNIEARPGQFENSQVYNLWLTDIEDIRL